jgi:hypothetical protein
MAPIHTQPLLNYKLNIIQIIQKHTNARKPTPTTRQGRFSTPMLGMTWRNHNNSRGIKVMGASSLIYIFASLIFLLHVSPPQRVTTTMAITTRSTKQKPIGQATIATPASLINRHPELQAKRLARSPLNSNVNTHLATINMPTTRFQNALQALGSPIDPITNDTPGEDVVQKVSGALPPPSKEACQATPLALPTGADQVPLESGIMQPDENDTNAPRRTLGSTPVKTQWLWSGTHLLLSQRSLKSLSYRTQRSQRSTRTHQLKKTTQVATCLTSRRYTITRICCSKSTPMEDSRRRATTCQDSQACTPYGQLYNSLWHPQATQRMIK